MTIHIREPNPCVHVTTDDAMTMLLFYLRQTSYASILVTGLVCLSVSRVTRKTVGDFM